MNIFTNFFVLYGFASQKTKRDEGFVIMCKVEKLLPLPLDAITDEQISVFKSVVAKKLTTAECICLKAHLEDMQDVFNPDNTTTESRIKYCLKYKNIYNTYLKALSEVM